MHGMHAPSLADAYRCLVCLAKLRFVVGTASGENLPNAKRQSQMTNRDFHKCPHGEALALEKPTNPTWSETLFCVAGPRDTCLCDPAHMWKTIHPFFQKPLREEEQTWERPTDPTWSGTLWGGDVAGCPGLMDIRQPGLKPGNVVTCWPVSREML